ncbi:MAG: class I SAM-dependent methyltransferase [Pseudomonadota bacterium]
MPTADKPTTTQFGHQQVTSEEKTVLVNEVFSSVAERYDIMNDLMSFGTHRLMKRMLIELSGARAGDRFLDLAGGTADVATLLAPILGRSGQIVLADRNLEMMLVGRERLHNAGHLNVALCQLVAEQLPFPDDTFDGVTLAFGLRNFTDKLTALKELVRVLKPGKRLLVLEFSKPRSPLLGAAYAGFQRLWPLAGRAVVGDAESYRYLVESIEVHPNQEQLKLLIEDAGFSEVTCDDLVGGVAAIHRGVAPLPSNDS